MEVGVDYVGLVDIVREGIRFQQLVGMVVVIVVRGMYFFSFVCFVFFGMGIWVIYFLIYFMSSFQ